MSVNLNAWLSMISILAFCLLLSGCLGNGDNEPHAAQGAHLNFPNMGRYSVELNMTDNDEYSINILRTDEGAAITGPPDRRSGPFNYTSYSRDIMDKSNGKRKLSLKMDYYNANMTIYKDNLLELGLSRWPWDGSAQYESHNLRNYDWITAKGALKNEIDAACWIDDRTILSLKMFDLNQSDSLAILDSVIARPV